MRYSITSSAMASSRGGMSRPSILGGREVNDQLELGRLLDGQVRRIGTVEDTSGIDPDLTIHIDEAGAVAHEPAGFGVLTQRKGGGKRMACGQQGQLHAPGLEERVGATNRATARSRTSAMKTASISPMLLAL